MGVDDLNNIINQTTCTPGLKPLARVSCVVHVLGTRMGLWGHLAMGLLTLASNLGGMARVRSTELVVVVGAAAAAWAGVAAVVDTWMASKTIDRLLGASRSRYSIPQDSHLHHTCFWYLRGLAQTR